LIDRQLRKMIDNDMVWRWAYLSPKTRIIPVGGYPIAPVGKDTGCLLQDAVNHCLGQIDE